MPKRKTDERDERIKTLESALAWADQWIDMVEPDGTSPAYHHCGECGVRGDQVALSNPEFHYATCRYRSAMELLHGKRPRKWETK